MTQENDTAVIDALKASDLVQIKAALAAGGSANCVDSDGYPALHLATQVTGAECVKALLERGAKVDTIGPYEQTAFYSAASWTNEDAALALLEAGADPALHPSNRPSAFMEACFYGATRLVDWFIAKGVDVNAIERDQSALARAVYTWSSRPEASSVVAARLLEAGAKVDASTLKVFKALKGKVARDVAAKLGVAAPKAKVVKPAEVGEFKHPLFERLKTFLELFASRADLEIRTPLTIDTARVRDLDEPYPADAGSFAASATDVAFSYRVKDEPESQGFLYLSLAGLGDSPDFLDEAKFDECYELDCDREGVGFAAWFRVAGGKGHILWSIEDGVQFKTLTEYLTKGARRGFGVRWQDAKDKRADAALLARSLPTKTPADTVRKGLLARGVKASMADDLIEWLGDRAVLLLPKPE